MGILDTQFIIKNVFKKLLIFLPFIQMNEISSTTGNSLIDIYIYNVLTSLMDKF